MASYSTNEFKSGLKVMLDGDPCSIIENEFHKPGKGRAINRVKLRNLITGRVLERTFTSGDSLEGADIAEVEMQYLYSDDDFMHFMDPASYDQHAIPLKVVAEAKQWLKEQDVCNVMLYNGQPLTVSPPTFVNLAVIDTAPGARGDTVTGGNKPATLETGAVIKVPLFIENGEVLKVDTRTGEYVSRIK